MVNKTTNFGLTKPLPEEFYDVQVQNDNMDIIDEELKKLSENTPDVSGQIKTHNEDVSAHADIRSAIDNLTAADVGAAPSGYGLGEFYGMRSITAEELNAPKGNGWYLINTSQEGDWSELVSFTNGTVWGVVKVEGMNQNYCRETIYNWYYGHTYTRTGNGSTWDSWEWVNPPMGFGVEYRTIERIGAKIVYKKNINGVIHYKLDGETEWKPYANAIVVSTKVTLTTGGWTLGSDERYYQTVNVTGVTADTPVITVDVDLSTTDADAKIAYLEAWAIPSANEVTQGAGTLTFYAWEIPTVNIPVNVGVM